jgi:hypothetical protein
VQNRSLAIVEKVNLSYTLMVDKRITIIKQSDSGNSGYVPGTMEERISMVWSLTCEAVSMSKKIRC